MCRLLSLNRFRFKSNDPPALFSLLADNHCLARLGLKVILTAEKDFTVVGEATDGYQLQRLSLGAQPDIVLLALNLPGPSPAEIVASLCERCPATKIVILAARSEEKR